MIMHDLISRAALYDAMREKEWQNWPPLDEIDAVIEKAPAVDAVEVVRCKDCEFGQKPTVCERLDTVVKPNDFCSRGVKKDQEEECVSPDEALWLIVKEAGFHDGVLYTMPMIACSACLVAALHEDSGGMGHGGPQISRRWFATHYCPNCGKEMKNWRREYEAESSGGGMPE